MIILMGSRGVEGVDPFTDTVRTHNVDKLFDELFDFLFENISAEIGRMSALRFWKISAKIDGRIMKTRGWPKKRLRT